jgi:Fe-S protein assembly chaperone HscA
MSPQQSPSGSTDELIVGIDLGTTNSLVALVSGGQPRILIDSGQRIFVPSVVSFVEGRPLVGSAARMRAIDSPRETVHSVKRLMGRSLAELDAITKMLPYELVEKIEGERRLLRVRINGVDYAPEQISAMILKSLKERAERALGRAVSKAVITVPAYFDDSQRQATRDAGRIAGLEVLRIVNEPTAAALAYGLGRIRSDEHTVVVYDLGGGTFDVSVLKIKDGVFRVLSTHGDTHLGGDDFDIALIHGVADAIKEAIGVDVRARPEMLTRLRDAAEATKKRLSEDELAALRITDPKTEKAFEFDVKRSDFEALIEPLVARSLASCRQALSDAGLKPEQIDEVVLVGGSTRIPYVRAQLAALFGREPMTSLDPDEAVALGAAVQADILSSDRDNVLLLDVVPLSLGLETMGGAVSKLIMRNEPVPIVKKERYSTFKDNQSKVSIHVMQGERELVEHCRSLARFELTGLPPMPAGIPIINVTFMVDADGVLRVMAEEERSGAEASVEVVPVHGMTEGEVDSVVEDSIVHALEDVKAHRLIDLRNEARTVMKATRRTLRDVADVVPASDRADVDDAMEELAAVVDGSDVEKIAARLDQLNRLTEPLAQIILDRLTMATVKGKRLSDF